MDDLYSLIKFVIIICVVIGILFLFLRWAWSDEPMKIEDYESDYHAPERES